MQAVEHADSYGIGNRLVDSLSISEERQNVLFVALFLTSIGVFVGGNLLLVDVSVLQCSTQIALLCFAMLLVFYALSRSTGSVTWGLVLTYGLMLLVTYSRQAWLVLVVYGGALIALIHAIRFLRVERAQWALLMLMACIATATILGVTGAYTSFDMLDRLRAGNVYQDTLFHASIAAMIKNYSVESTGLHGLVEVPYHTLSHALFASISRLSGGGVIEVYGVANWFFFAPILIFSVTVCSVMLDETGQLSISLAWGIACVLLAASPFLLQNWGVWDSFFVSESYLVSLGLFLPGFMLLFKRRLNMSELLLVLILTALVSEAKTSVGLILAGLWFARVLLVRGESIRVDLAALTLSAVVTTWVTFRSAEAVQGAIGIVPLHFIGSSSFWGKHLVEAGRALLKGEALSLRSLLLGLMAIPSFFAFHFLLSWIIILRVAYTKRIRSVFTDPLSAYSVAAVAAGALVVFLFSMPGGAAYYFTNVAFFVALPGVVVLFAHAFGQWRVSSQPFLIFAILLVCLVSVRAFYRAGAMHPARSVSMHSAFIDSLIELRHTTQVNVVLQPTAEAFANNPVLSCTAQPFVYPAVSERPWIGVIPARGDCTYQFYGYSEYGITESQQTATVHPQLLPGMALLIWPHATAVPKSSDGVPTE